MLVDDPVAVVVLTAIPEVDVMVDTEAVLDTLAVVEVVEADPVLLVEEPVAEVDEPLADAVYPGIVRVTPAF